MPITGAYGGVIGVDNTPSSSKNVTQITASGCFCRTTATATVVVIAGGGSGAYGGGGAGGMLVVACHPLPASTIPVTIGAGGGNTCSAGPLGAHGTDTVFGSATPLTSQGGMGGGGNSSNPTYPIGAGVHGSGGGGISGSPAAGGGFGRHPGPLGGCNPYEGNPGGAYSTTQGGGGGACNLGEGRGHPGGAEQGSGGRGRDLTPLGVPTSMGDCGYFCGGGAGRANAHPSNPWSLAIAPLTNKAHRVGKKAIGGGGRGQTGEPTLMCICCVPQTPTAGLANHGGGGGGGGYPGSAPYGALIGFGGGSGTVLVIQDVAGASANDGIYSMKEHYICVKSSRW